MSNAYLKTHGGGYKVNPVFGFTATIWTSGTACVYWGNPADHYSGVMVRYKIGAYPVSITDGTLAYDNGGGDVLQLDANTYVTGCTVAGLTIGTTYYFSAFSYTTSGSGTRHYSKIVRQAAWTAASVAPSAGSYTGSGGEIPGVGYAFYSDGVYTVPAGIRALDVFCVGGGGGAGGAAQSYSMNWYGGGGGAGGGVFTSYAAAVIPGQQIPVTIGQGGAGGASYTEPYEDAGGAASPGGNGGNTYFGVIGAAGGAAGGGGSLQSGPGSGGSGTGSGGGAGSAHVSGIHPGGNGGTNGGNGYAGDYGGAAGTGQGVTTTPFGSGSGTAYSGGGAGGRATGGVYGGGSNSGNGTANSGGGGSGGDTGSGGAGGSGIVIIRVAA